MKVLELKALLENCFDHHELVLFVERGVDALAKREIGDYGDGSFFPTNGFSKDNLNGRTYYILSTGLVNKRIGIVKDEYEDLPRETFETFEERNPRHYD